MMPGQLETWCYTDRFAYYPGEKVALHFSSNAPSFGLRIERDDVTGPVVAEWNTLTARLHETPENAYAAGCGWPAGLQWTIPIGTPPGFYLLRVTTPQPSGTHWEYHHFLVVKAPSGSRARAALVLTTSTLLAYNDWGGANHYRGLGDDAFEVEGSPVASSQRPIARGFLVKPPGAPEEFRREALAMGEAPRYPAYEWARLNGYSRHHADAFWATYERPFIRWLFDAGYDVDLLTQSDLHYDRQCLDGYRCVLLAGHDEYWSWEMRDALDDFVDNGGRVARFGGNFQWQVRLSEDGGQQFCYRLPSLDPVTSTNPRRATTIWEARSVNRPGASSLGLNGMGGIYARYGAATPRSSGGFTVYRPEHWVFEGADLYYGDVLGGAPACLAAFEVDSVEYTFHRGLPYPTFEDGAPASLEILALCLAVKGESDHFRGSVPLGGPEPEVEDYLTELGEDVPDYLRENGMRGAGMIATFQRGRGEVFNGGSTAWPQALASGDPFVNRVALNVLDRYIGAPDR